MQFYSLGGQLENFQENNYEINLLGLSEEDSKSINVSRSFCCVWSSDKFSNSFIVNNLFKHDDVVCPDFQNGAEESH